MKLNVEKLKDHNIRMRLIIDKTIEEIKKEIEFWESEDNNVMILETLRHTLQMLEGGYENE